MKVCPTCHRPLGGVRSCFACHMPVGRDHKFHFEGCYIVHDDCANPTMRVLVSTPDLPTQEVFNPQAQETSPDAA